MAETGVKYSGKVHIKVVRADELRSHLGRSPTPMAMLRVSVAGMAQPELMKTSPMPDSNNPEWNEEFVLPVSDASQSQLECTIWDTSDPQVIPPSHQEAILMFLPSCHHAQQRFDVLTTFLLAAPAILQLPRRGSPQPRQAHPLQGPLH